MSVPSCMLNKITYLRYPMALRFSSSHVWMWELGHKERWVTNSWCFWTVVLEKTLKSPLDSKEIQPVNPKGNQSWIFTGRTDAEAAAPVLWPAIWRTDSLEKILMLGKIEGRRWRGQQRRIVGWHHWLDVNLSKLQELVMDREAWLTTVHGVEKSWIWLKWSDGPKIIIIFIGTLFPTHGDSLNTFCRIWRDFSQFSFSGKINDEKKSNRL